MVHSCVHPHARGYRAQNASDPARVPRSLEGEAIIGSQEGPGCRQPQPQQRGAQGRRWGPWNTGISGRAQSRRVQTGKLEIVLGVQDCIDCQRGRCQEGAMFVGTGQARGKVMGVSRGHVPHQESRMFPWECVLCSKP